MSRLRAETMPAVTVPPRLNGLPIAITHSPSRSLSESPNLTAVSGFVGLNFSTARSVFLSTPTSLGLDLGAVVHDDVDLVGVRDDVIVGDDDAGGIDDEAGAERIGLVRLQSPSPPPLGRRRAVLEEVVEELLERRARRQLRHRAAAVAAALGLDGLRGRDVDHRVDHLLGDVGDAVRAAREGRRGDERAGRAEADRGQPGAQATGSGLWSQRSCRLLSKRDRISASTVRPNGASGASSCGRTFRRHQAGLIRQKPRR